MKTLDLKKDLKELYSASARKVEVIRVPKMQFAVIDGAIEKGQAQAHHPDSRKPPKPYTGFRIRSRSL